MNWIEVYRELYIAAAGVMIGTFLTVGYYRLRQPTRWAHGFFFVILALIGFMILSMLGFVAHLGDTTAPWRIYLYPLPLISLGVGTYLINTSEIAVGSHADEAGSKQDMFRDNAPDS
jgi:hypothetical protein